MTGLSTTSIRLIVTLLMMTGLAGLSTITNYSAVFEPIAKLSFSLTCFLLFIDVLVLSLAMLLFRTKKAKG